MKAHNSAVVDMVKTRTRKYVETIAHRETKGLVLVSSSQNDTRYMLRVLLELWGYEVAEANGNIDTVATAEACSPDVVLVDTSRLFDQDVEVVSSLRESKLRASVPVYVMSGFSQAAYLKSAFDKGATDVLVKPLDLDLLEEHLESAMPESRLEQY
jgi:CheY-like chemotaxis protein